MATYYVCLLKDTIVPFAEDEAMLRAYMSDMYKDDNPVIYKVNDEKLKKISEVYCIDEVVEQWDDMYFTSYEAEMVSQSLEEDAITFTESYKKMLNLLKYYDTPAAVKLRKALKEFKKERVTVNDMEIDEYDFIERLMEKVNLKKYTKSIFKRYRKSYQAGLDYNRKKE